MNSTVYIVGNRSQPSVLQRLRAHGAEVTELDCGTAERTRTSLRAAVAEGATRVGVIGGDGMVHTAIQELAGTEVAIGLLPSGTGNDFARALGLPLDDTESAILRAVGEPAAVDAIRTSRGWVATIVAAGFPAKVNARANRMRYPRGSSKYTLATFAVLPSLRSDEMTLTIDGVRQSVDVSILACANTAFFGGGMKICPDASAFDAQMDVAIVSSLSRTKLLRMLPSVFSGSHIGHPSVRVVRCSSIRLDGELDVWGDGELLGSAPIEMECVPGALKIAGVRQP